MQKIFTLSVLCILPVVVTLVFTTSIAASTTTANTLKPAAAHRIASTAVMRAQTSLKLRLATGVSLGATKQLSPSTPSLLRPLQRLLASPVFRWITAGVLSTYAASKFLEPNKSQDILFDKSSGLFSHATKPDFIQPNLNLDLSAQKSETGEHMNPKNPSPMVPLWTTDSLEVKEQLNFFHQDQELALKQNLSEADKNTWELFQSNYFHSRYYDTHHISPPHPELIHLIRSYLALNRAQTIKFLKNIKTPNKRRVLQAEAYQRWLNNPAYLTRFINSKLTTIKELHLFLRIFFSSLETSQDITEYYGENPTILDRRGLEIISLMRDYHGDTYPKPHPIKEKFWNPKDALPFIQSMGYHQLKQRLSTVEVKEGVRLLDLKLLPQINSQMMAAFFMQLQSSREQQIFVDHILQLTDAPPISSRSQELTHLISQFSQFLIAAKDRKKSIDTQKFHQAFNEMPHDQILHQISRSKPLKHYELESYSNFHAQTVIDFSKIHIKSNIDAALFFIKFLGMDHMALSDIAKHFHKSEYLLLRRYNELKKEFLKMVQHKPTMLIPYSYGRLPLNDLKALLSMIVNSTPEDIINRLKIYLKTSKENVPNDMSYLENPEIFNIYMNEVLSSDIKLHIFLSLIIKLDQTDLADIHEHYNTPVNKIKSIHRELTTLLIEIGRYGSLKPHKTQKPLSAKQSTKSLKAIFAAHDIQEVIETLKFHILNMEQLKEDHYGLLTQSVHVLNSESIQDLTKNVLSNESLSWHLFLTEFLQLDSVSISKISDMYGINRATIVAHRHLLLTKAMKIFLKHAGTLKELQDLMTKDYNASKEKFENLSHEEILSLIEESPFFNDYPQEYFITKDHLLQFLGSKYFANPRSEAQKSRHHTFYRMLSISHASRIELAIAHDLKNNYFVRRHMSDLKAEFLKILKKDQAH